MRMNDEPKVWYVSFRKDGVEICDTKVCSKNYITAAAWARREARELGTCDKIVLECGDSFKQYVIPIK
jgi:hypothetical protein